LPRQNSSEVSWERFESILSWVFDISWCCFEKCRLFQNFRFNTLVGNVKCQMSRNFCFNFCWDIFMILFEEVLPVLKSVVCFEKCRVLQIDSMIVLLTFPV
jgi:hypothetical protein